MAALNKVQLIGNLGRDPETRHTSGDQICNFSVAVTESWKDKNGDKQEHTEWVRVVIWGKLAEIADKYLRKGSSVYLEGKLKTRKFEKDGKDQYITEVVADRMQMLGGRRDDGDRESSRDDDRGGRDRSSRDRDDRGDRGSRSEKKSSKFDDLEDDIPF